VKIVEGIHRVDEASRNIAHSNVYLVINSEGLLVVDTGTQGNAKKIVEYIQEIGYQPKEVSTIILTHFHMDHTGSAKALKELTGAQVAASAIDGEVIEGKKPYPKPKNLLMRAATSFIKPEPVPVDIQLNDGDITCGLKVVATPGHTKGSIMLFDVQRKTLFAGDTLRFDGKKISAGPSHFSWDQAKERESIKKVAEWEFDVLLPGHGEILVGGAAQKVKQFAQTQ
jgi:glyoxylase-like metal-dependent hydrolase (beta-lactamase superfamily II)